MGTGSLRQTNKAYFSFRCMFATLYFKFKPKYWYWLIMVVFRKLLIVTFTLAFNINPVMQFTMILLVMFVAYVLQASGILLTDCATRLCLSDFILEVRRSISYCRSPCCGPLFDVEP